MKVRKTLRIIQSGWGMILKFKRIRMNEKKIITIGCMRNVSVYIY